MEKIKFRYWDNFNGCYSYSNNFECLSDFFLQMEQAEAGENEPVLEMATGMEDEKGVAIFEGDQLTWNYRDRFRRLTGDKIIAAVVFESGEFLCHGQRLQTLLHLNDCKVVGNVHMT